MPASPTDKPAASALGKPPLYESLFWIYALPFYSSSGLLFRSVYDPARHLSSGRRVFYSAIAVMCGCGLILHMAHCLWRMRHRVRRAWRELPRRVGNGTSGWRRSRGRHHDHANVHADENAMPHAAASGIRHDDKGINTSNDDGSRDDRGGVEDPLLADGNAKDLEADSAASLASPAQEHERHEVRPTKRKWFWKFLVFLCVAWLGIAGLEVRMDMKWLKFARSSGNDYISPWMWVRLFVSLSYGFAALGMVGLLAFALYIMRRQAREARLA